MFGAFWFAAIVALLSDVAFCQLDADVDMDEVDAEMQEFERLAFGPHRRHRHHRHHRFHDRRPLLSRHKRTALFSGPSVVSPGAAPIGDVLPGRHPTVETKLRHMDEEMQELTGRHQAASLARETLEDSVKKAVSHMNDAVGIKRELARTEARIRSEDRKLRRLEEDRIRLDRTHGHLVSSLHHIMEPKIHFAELRLQQKETVLHEAEENLKRWKAEESKFHDASISFISARKDAQIRLAAAKEEKIKAQHDEDVAEKELSAVKHSVGVNVEGFQVAQAHAQAAASKEERGRESVGLAKKSLKKMSSIMNMQQNRVDESMAIGKDRVQGKIQELSSVREKSKERLVKLEQEYSAWKGEERDWAQQVSTHKLANNQASQAYAEHQQKVLDAANAKVAYEAESGSDWAWDEWPSAHKQDTDEVDLSEN